MPALTMPLFVDPADVILRMQLGSDLSGVEEVVSTGIIGAQAHVQRILDGKLARQSQDCMFFLDAEAFSGIQPDGVFRLEIPSGFIRRDTPVTVTISGAASADTTVTPFGVFTAVDATLVKVDYDRGYVLLDKSYGNRYVRVVCDTGFEPGTNYVPDTSPPEQIPMEQIPLELYEAIMSMVPVIFDASQTTNRNPEAEPQYRKAADHAALILQPFVRTRGLSFRPMWK